MKNVELNTINTKIATLGNAEKVTKAVLAELSRDLLQYVVLQDNWDVQAINRLLAVLTPMNRKTAVLFFKYFTPFQFDKDTGVFGAMPKDKKAKAKGKQDVSDMALIFLDGEDNNIWTWAEHHVKTEERKVNWAKNITRDVQNAMSEDKGGMSLPDVLAAVLAAGLSTDDVTSALGVLYAQDQEADMQEAA